MEKRLGLWFDAEGDFLEFTIGKPRKGFFRPVNGDMWKRVDVRTGKIIGFAILNFIKRFEKAKKPEELSLPVKVELKPIKK